ncbi:unnamed protein product, partial [marine sediment metagenome]
GCGGDGEEPGADGYNEVIDCTFMDNNVTGVYILDSGNNTVRDCNLNNLYPQDDAGTYLFGVIIAEEEIGSIDNKIYYNNFIDIYGGRNGNDSCASPNRRDNGVNIGNYWSNFDEDSEGAWDNDSNGIVDYNYTVNGSAGALDHYPLRNPNPFGIVTITRVSQTPSNIKVNSTGDVTILFNITTATTPINSSSILVVHTINQTYDGAYYLNASYRLPNSTKQPDRVRADNRNENLWFEKFNASG